MRAPAGILGRLLGGGSSPTSAPPVAELVAADRVELADVPRAVAEGTSEPTDLSSADEAGQVDPDQSADFEVVDPQTGLPVDDVEVPR